MPVASGPRAWLVRTDGWGRPDGGAWIAAGLVQAVERAAADLPPPVNRELPLIGVPLAGSGAGGLATRRGEIVTALVPALQDVARRKGVDVALVLFDDQDHAAVQAERVAGPGVGVLTDEEVDQADELGRRAAAGHLVLFLGAGVSMAAGLPS